jgi:hypothetical protein
MTWRERATPYIKGLAGMLVGLAIWTGGAWVIARYEEFKVMRQVVANTIQIQQQQQAQAASAQTPAQGAP